LYHKIHDQSIAEKQKARLPHTASVPIKKSPVAFAATGNLFVEKAIS
jgi:hypothetical protein